ncbi:EamA family transporter RarD [Bordetella trematum]|uniref:EamA family transporter RarD n=1 Tax=Bordetella trematum TaxID=123899 RepID=UPI001FAE88E4|nr:EamA family transporter RarD [Bordetella trematum]
MSRPAVSMASGVGCSLLASSLFALMYYYASWLAPLDSLQIYGWRIVLSLPLLTAVLMVAGQGRQLRALARRLRNEPLLWLGALASAFLLGVQLWLFMWAPLHGHALDVSLGYFLLPLMLVLAGRWCFGERLSPWRKLASVLAGLGVAYEILQAGYLSWPMALVALGFPPYYLLRRRLGTDNLAGLWLDLALSLPAALAVVAGGGSWALPEPVQLGLLAGLGVISATALLAMIAASQRLPLALFGLLGYVEPLLLVVVALLLGEQIEAARWPTYLAIWAAVGVLCAEAVARLWQARWPRLPRVGAGPVLEQSQP